MSEFVKRNISTWVAIFGLFVVFYIGRSAIYTVMILVGILMMYEFQNALKFKDAIGYVSLVALAFAAIFDVEIHIVAAGICIWSVLVFVFTGKDIRGFAQTSLSILYLSVPIYFGIKILRLYGSKAFLLSLLIPMTTDIFAYVVGRLIGRTPLVPKISPKKTVEGLIGGVVLSVAFSVLYSVYALQLSFESRYYLAIPIFVLLSLLAQIGDFAASKIKRELGLKDYGDVIPGHGGLLDRFDSYLLIFPPFLVLMMYCSAWMN